MITQFIIYGERHSGTKFLYRLITDNLKIQQAKNFEHKHFFTPSNILLQDKDTIEKTIFFCIVRNPYDWIMAFHNERHHCGIIGSNNIYTFMSKPWLSRQPFLGPEILADRHLYNKTKYKNIFHMRSTKNTFMYSILPTYVKYHIFLRYEDFLDQNYATYIINLISSSFNINKKQNNNTCSFHNKRNYYINLDQPLLSYMNNSIDWSIENTIGYQKSLSADSFTKQST